MHQLGGQICNHTGAFCGFRQDCIPGCQRCCNLPGENCQWKIPWADAGENAGLCIGKRLRLARIIAQKVNGLAQFSNAVGQGFARFLR